jgi:hypothetical protein
MGRDEAKAKRRQGRIRLVKQVGDGGDIIAPLNEAVSDVPATRFGGRHSVLEIDRLGDEKSYRERVDRG